MHLYYIMFTMVDGVLDHKEMTEEHDASLEEFFNAAVNGNAHRLQQLLDEHRININATNDWGRTAIQVFKCSRPDIAEILLKHGADPNIQDKHFQDLHLSSYRTPAHDIAEQGFLDTMKVLLKHGADVTLRSKMGYSPAHIAAEKGRLDTLEYLSGAIDLMNCRADDGSTPFDLIPKSITLTDRQRTWVEAEKNAKPKSLKYLTRLRIRHCMRHNLKRLQTFPTLPLSIKKYLLLQD
ncbi:cyclin-dependent kinase 4 inhibitor D [Lingula anatina]|uniref:Cyclin-dependent kinase 4 inhibitor D n=1 Tax=Lingula anatina TaxID=7574 RepID=A0A1S3IFN1_LINAN|nr:cyclin-dependent kinase 4 inhibitor D [Lingula anatina]|eukprot:XP_013397037.1 cyclin-dependent kinase 4 inhibitor D [Lingula anatina]